MEDSLFIDFVYRGIVPGLRNHKNVSGFGRTGLCKGISVQYARHEPNALCLVLRIPAVAALYQNRGEPNRQAGNHLCFDCGGTDAPFLDPAEHSVVFLFGTNLKPDAAASGFSFEKSG